MGTSSTSLAKLKKAEHQERAETYKVAAMFNCMVVIIGSFVFVSVGQTLFEHSTYLYKAVAGVLGIAGVAMLVCLSLCVYHICAANEFEEH